MEIVAIRGPVAEDTSVVATEVVCVAEISTKVSEVSTEVVSGVASEATAADSEVAVVPPAVVEEGVVSVRVVVGGVDSVAVQPVDQSVRVKGVQGVAEQRGVVVAEAACLEHVVQVVSQVVQVDGVLVGVPGPVAAGERRARAGVVGVVREVGEVRPAVVRVRTAVGLGRRQALVVVIVVADGASTHSGTGDAVPVLVVSAVLVDLRGCKDREHERDEDFVHKNDIGERRFRI